MIYEDFVPVSDGEALITRGRSLTALGEIALAPYRVEGERVVLSGKGRTLASGGHLRLGNLNGGVLGYSCSGVGLVNTPCFSPSGIQPFTTDADCYWNEPGRGIWRNGELFLSHWNGGAVGKPAVAGRWLYFEARGPGAPMPQGWEVWRVSGEDREFVCIGANPHPWNDWLFFTDFSAYPEFFTRRVRHCV